MAKTAKAARPYDTVGGIIAFEDGRLDDPEVLALFQHLVNTGLAWLLPGSYGRLAKSLIEAGQIAPARR